VQDLSHSMVHYLLTIHKLREEKGYARVTDIANELKLTKGSVSTAINNLKKKDLVCVKEDNKFLFLSDSGHDQVHKILSTRTLLFYFLKDFVGVKSDVAQQDSCQIEHLFSEETQTKLFSFMKSLACDCGTTHKTENSSTLFKTTLDLCKFKSQEDFINSQTGDSHLED